MMESISFHGSNHGLQIGDNHGSIQFHLPSVRAENPPSPLSTVPFTRDLDFVRRDILLDQIYEKSLVPGSRIALVGLGGVGKSQLAIEYSYQVRSQSPATWAFWVHASNEARLKQSFQDIADQVKIPGRQDPQVNIFKLVENWLRGEKIGKWVCILDNVDDDQLLCSVPVAGSGDPMRGQTTASTKTLLEYVPRSRNGFVIITSRTREVALKMVHHNDLIEVKPMQGSEALQLLQKKLGQPGEMQESRQLVNALEFMPLAIVQAASCIRNRVPRYSVSQYLREFQGSDREAIKLLKKEAGHLYRDWEAKSSTLLTWQISFDYIRQTKPSAADLLSLMSFFDRQGIPEHIIRHQPTANYISISEPLNESSDEELFDSDISPDFEDDVQVLRDYSFISISDDGKLFTMHRLVQLSMCAWLETHGQREQWKEKFISSLCYNFLLTAEYENWEECRLLYPHIKSAISQQPESPVSLLEWAALLFRGAQYASESGNVADVKKMATKSRYQRVISLGESHEDVLDSTDMLATAYGLEGRWEEAERFQVQVMETRKMKLGEDHPDTLTSMANLASTYRNQGRWEEAEQLNVQVIETRKTKLGEDHPSTLSCMANLASTYWNQGRWEEAEQLNVQVIETSKTKLGEDHPDTLTSMANLASTYMNQGRWAEAKQLNVQVIETRKTKLGENHPDTLTSMANLASTYINLGRWEEAEQLNMQVIETRKTKLGEDHPDTLTSMANLASTYWNQGRWQEAEQLNVQVMETSIAKLGEDHPNTLTTMANLAFTWKSSGRDAEAINLLRNALAKQKQIVGLNHPNTLSKSKTLVEWETEGQNMNVLNKLGS